MMQEIPYELLQQIFKHIPENDLRRNVSLTSRKWRNVVQEFHLVESKVVLNSPFDNWCEKILIDFKKYPSFGPRVKIAIIDYQEHYEYMYGGDGVEKLNLFMKACTNLEDLKFHITDGDFLPDILSKLISPEEQFKSRIKLLELNCGEIDEGYRESVVVVDINKLICDTISSLHELIVYLPLDYNYRSCIAFKSNNLYDNINWSLRKMKMVCPSAEMTKECLEYIVSGQLGHLEDLNLFVTLVYCNDDSNRVVGSMEKEDNITLWDKVSIFCLTATKNYNVTLLNNRGSGLFSIDNCKDEKERHRKNFDEDDYYNNYDDNDYYVYDEGSGYWD